MRPLRSLAFLALPLFAASEGGPARPSGPASVAATPAPVEALRLQTSPGETRGGLGSGAREVRFTARGEGGGRLLVRIELPDLELLATQAAPDRPIALDGGGARLEAASLERLRALAHAVEGRLDPWRRPLEPRDALLVRALLLWSEAPEGSVAGRSEVARRKPSAPAEAGRSAPAREQDDEDAVDLLPGGCTLTTHAEVCHDGPRKGHAFECRPEPGGCSRETGCPGRCGPGCGPSGSGTYSRDCLDLDRCAAEHARDRVPGRGCADEWAEAFDDLLLGPVSCLTTGC